MLTAAGVSIFRPAFPAGNPGDLGLGRRNSPIFGPNDECEASSKGQKEGKELVSREAEEGFWGGSEEFVAEAKEAVGQEVEVEMLAWEGLGAAEEEDDEEGQEIEADLHRDG